MQYALVMCLRRAEKARSAIWEKVRLLLASSFPLVVIRWVRGSIIGPDDDMGHVQITRQGTYKCKNKYIVVSHVLLAIGQSFEAREEFQARFL